MKKQNLLKLALVSLAMFVFMGAGAQDATYQQFSRNDQELPDQITLGATMPFWVFPSDYFNPDFDPTAPADEQALHLYIEGQADILSTFTWSVTGGFDLSGFTGNYVEIPVTVANNFPVGGPYTISVFETPAAPWDGCPGVAQTFNFSVVAQPTMSLTTPVADINACETDPSLTTAVVATLTGNVAGSLNLQWDYRAYTVLSTWDGSFPVDVADIDDADISAEVGYVATDYPTEAAPQTGRAIGANTLVASKDWVTYLNKVTVYEFELIGVNDKISRKSDYLAIVPAGLDNTAPENYTYYPNGAITRRIVVKPTPQTGPIYHVPNSWGL